MDNLTRRASAAQAAPSTRHRTKWISLFVAARAYRVTPFTLSVWARHNRVKAKVVAGHWWFPSSTLPGGQ